MKTNDQLSVQNGSRLAIYAEIPDLKEICVSCVAFSNQAGGEIAIGVNPDTFEIYGLSDQEVTEAIRAIPKAVAKHCSPTIVPELYARNIGGRHILMVRIERGSMKPYYIREEGDRDGVYVRQCKKNRFATKDQIDEMVRQTRNQSFDEVLLRDSSLADLDLSGLKADVHRLVHMEFSDADFLRLGLLDHMVPTRALAILAGDEQRFAYAKLICTRHRLSVSGGFEDETEEMKGSLPRKVKAAINFLMDKSGFCSQCIPQDVLLEAIVNAVVHRDYAIKQAVQIDAYPDRLMISSPGLLPKTMTFSKIREGTSETRNPLLANFMRSTGFAGSWGTGIPKINAICIEEGIFTPMFVEEGIFFKVIFDKCKE